MYSMIWTVLDFSGTSLASLFDGGWMRPILYLATSFLTRPFDSPVWLLAKILFLLGMSSLFRRFNSWYSLSVTRLPAFVCLPVAARTSTWLWQLSLAHGSRKCPLGGPDLDIPNTAFCLSPPRMTKRKSLRTSLLTRWVWKIQKKHVLLMNFF